MKRVLIIADSNLSLSGVPVVFMSIVRELHSEYNFDVLVLKDNDMYFEKEFLSYGGKVYRYNQNKPDKFLKKLIWTLFAYKKDVKRFLKRNINLSDYDVIHSFNEGFSYPFIKEAKKAGIKRRILHICSAKSAYPLKRTFSQLIFNWYQKKAMRICTNIAFVSEKSLQMNNYKNKGVVLYNIYDEIKFGKITNCNHNKLVLTQIGTYSSRKNQIFSLNLIKKLKEKYPNVIINIVGKEIEPGYLDKMNNYIKENNLSNNVKFLGSNVNRISLNEDTSFIIYPSTMESFGLVLIESQGCGIHCFANEDIPNDANMGNVDFLKLDVDLWSKKISDFYEKNGNIRKEPINKEKFNKTQFKNTLRKLYEN